MEVTKGTVDHAAAVAEFWNVKAQDANSWWYGSPPQTSEDIAALLPQGFSLAVALEGADLIGFGLWLGPRLTGFTATNSEAFYRMMRVWCDENPGERGLSVIPARDTIEKAWFDELNYGELIPAGYKPIGPGDDPADRTPWTFRLEGNLDELGAAIDAKLEEVTG